jgi:hypothetical protein
MTDYMVTQQWGEKRLDIHALASDLAPALGAQLVHDESEHYRGRLEIDGLRLCLSAVWGARSGRVKVSAYDPRADRLHYRSDLQRIPSITLDATRPIDKLAGDIKRRLIEPARAIVDQVTLRLAQQAHDDAQLLAHAEALKARWPFLEVKIGADRAQIYGRHNGGYFTGSMRADGGVRIERVDTQADRVPALLGVVFGS